MAANPYVQGWREWDERYADLVIGKRNWQIVAGGLLVLSLILGSINGVCSNGRGTRGRRPAAISQHSVLRCKACRGARWRTHRR